MKRYERERNKLLANQIRSPRFVYRMYFKLPLGADSGYSSRQIKDELDRIVLYHKELEKIRDKKHGVQSTEIESDELSEVYNEALEEALDAGHTPDIAQVMAARAVAEVFGTEGIGEEEEDGGEKTPNPFFREEEFVPVKDLL